MRNGSLNAPFEVRLAVDMDAAEAVVYVRGERHGVLSGITGPVRPCAIFYDSDLKEVELVSLTSAVPGEAHAAAALPSAAALARQARRAQHGALSPAESASLVGASRTFHDLPRALPLPFHCPSTALRRALPLPCHCPSTCPATALPLPRH